MTTRKKSDKTLEDKLGQIDDSQEFIVEDEDTKGTDNTVALSDIELKEITQDTLQANTVESLLKYAKNHGVSIPNGASKSVIIGKIMKEKAVLAYGDLHKDKNASKTLPYETLQYPVRVLNAKQLRELFQNTPDDLINPKLLVRCHIGVNDPNKHKQPAELFATYIRGVGMIRYAVPLQLGPEEAYHIPYAILQMMVGKTYQIHSDRPHHRSKEGDQEGTLHQTRILPTYSITVLPPLDKETLDSIVDSHNVQKNKKA